MTSHATGPGRHPNGAPALELDGLSKTFGSTVAADAIRLEVRGGLVAFVFAGLAANLLAWRWWRAANEVARNGAAREEAALGDPRRWVRRP